MFAMPNVDSNVYWSNKIFYRDFILELEVEASWNRKHIPR